MQVLLLYDRRNCDQSVAGLGARRADRYFVSDFGSSVALFESRGIEAVKVAMGIERMSWRRGTARRNRYCRAVLEGQEARKIKAVRQYSNRSN